MVYVDDYGCYVEDRGCYYALLYKIRENRRMIVVSVLLAVVVVSVVAGLYNGVTVKEYSSWAVTVGIFFPSVVLVFICIYVAFTCGQTSISTILPSVHHLEDGNQSPFQEHATQQEKSPATLRVRRQSKHSRGPIDPMQKFRLEQTTSSRICEETEDAPSNWAAKRHFRSLSNSDISRYQSRNAKTLDRGFERPESTTYRGDDSKYLKRTRCQSVPERKGFKRCVSDTAYKYRNTKNRENMTDCRIKSNENAERCGDRRYSVEDYDQRSSEYFSEVFEQPVTYSPYLTENLNRNDKTSEDYDKMICYELVNEVEGKRNRQQVCADKYSPQTIRGKNWIHNLTKSDVPCFYPTSKIEDSEEFRHTLNLPCVSPTEKDDFRDNKKKSYCSFVKSEQNASSFFSDLPKNEKRFKYILSQQENAISEHLKRKAIYYAKDRESIRPLPVYVSDNCKYFPEKSKMVQRQSSRNEENIKNYI